MTGYERKGKDNWVYHGRFADFPAPNLTELEAGYQVAASLITACEECNGTGEVETGIGMLSCNICYGRGIVFNGEGI